MLNNSQLQKLLFLIPILVLFLSLNAQEKFVKPLIIVLGEKINNINEEFSGMTLSGNSLYLLPQYGDALQAGDSIERDTVLTKKFKIYSYPLKSINYAIDNHSALNNPDEIEIKNLSLLPDSVKKIFEGFEAIAIVRNTVFLSIETHDEDDLCYLVKGNLDIKKKEININPLKIIALPRFTFIKNAGFESLAYLPVKKKLLAMYEFNTIANGGTGYLIDTSFKTLPKPVIIPKLFFRLTDITATSKDAIYGINYYWNGDYNSYLNNCLVRNPEKEMKKFLPGLRDSISASAQYLKNKTTCFAQIVKLNNRTSLSWKQVISFENSCTGNNWEGLVLFRKGALVISDANRNSKQVTTLAYVEFSSNSK